MSDEPREHPLAAWLGPDWTIWHDRQRNIVLVLHGPTGLHMRTHGGSWWLRDKEPTVAEALGPALNWATEVYRGEVVPTIERIVTDGIVTHKVTAFTERYGETP